MTHTKKLCFVQFHHSGEEHEPDNSNGTVKSWNKLKLPGKKNPDKLKDNPHKRKFMRLRGGAWIDEDGRKHKGDLDAWGESEPESNVISEFNPPEGDTLHPKYLWNPYWIRKGNYRNLHNTDPFIFGNRFLYSNCHQPSKPGLKYLAPGSLILFGSKKIDL